MIYSRYKKVGPIRFITVVRWMLLIAMISGVTLLLWPLLTTHMEGQQDPIQNLFSVKEEKQQLQSGEYQFNTHTQIEKPVLYGKDSEDQPFRIGAERAVERSQDEALLEGVKGHIDLINTNRWIDVTATKADYFAKEQRLKAYGIVTVVTSDGYHFQTSEAVVTHQNSYRIVGEKSVEVHGPGTHIKAGGFIINEQDRSIVFTGKVSSTYTKPQE